MVELDANRVQVGQHVGQWMGLDLASWWGRSMDGKDGPGKRAGASWVVIPWEPGVANLGASLADLAASLVAGRHPAQGHHALWSSHRNPWGEQSNTAPGRHQLRMGTWLSRQGAPPAPCAGSKCVGLLPGERASGARCIWALVYRLAKLGKHGESEARNLEHARVQRLHGVERNAAGMRERSVGDAQRGKGKKGKASGSELGHRPLLVLSPPRCPRNSLNPEAHAAAGRTVNPWPLWPMVPLANGPLAPWTWWRALAVGQVGNPMGCSPATRPLRASGQAFASRSLGASAPLNSQSQPATSPPGASTTHPPGQHNTIPTKRAIRPTVAALHIGAWVSNQIDPS